MSSPGLGYKRQPSIKGQVTGTGQAVDCLGTTYAAVYITGMGTISAGTLIIETADYDESQASLGYAGTWAAIGSPFDLTTLTGGGANGKQAMVALGAGPWSFIRCRVGTDVSGTGGKVSAVIVAA